MIDIADNVSFEDVQEKVYNSSSLTSSLSTECDNLSYNRSDSISSEENSEDTTNTSYIKEVYSDNLEEAMKEIISIKKNYKYIGMDTEFPGCVYKLKSLTKDFYYKSMKDSVNKTKLIQLGITFTNDKGEFPQKYEYHTWQFNFKFDQETDNFSQESINLLKNNGINFDKLKKNGISESDFAEKLMGSGLVLNPNCKWISYHGSYDFAYLLKILLKDNLPESEEEFIKLLKMYFPTFYDVRMMIRDNENLFKGGLNKLISNLNIERKGINHQAGSDAIATVEAFHKLIENGDVSEYKIKKFKNVLYGLGIGEDNKNTIKYINMKNIENPEKIFKEEKNKELNKMNSQRNIMYNNTLIYFQQQQKQKQKLMNNLMYCKNINNCYSFALYNSYQIMRNNILINNMKAQKTASKL